jgi:AAA+ ATPase superfamily predicted ATPase
MEVIGRETEKAALTQCLEAKRPEFVAIYGRRRIGKTFLVREFLRDSMVFSLTGAVNVSMRDQLRIFDEAIEDWGGKKQVPATDWLDAFRLLKEYIKRLRHKRKKVIFIDEVPWLATQKSGFISALDHFWNSFASAREDITLIICGSASSWITDNVIANRGGLHNRVTRQIRIEPFTLAECEQYYHSRGIDLNRIQITQLYMIIGGIPYYMDYAQKGLSPEQIVDSLFFVKGAPLANEFSNLYASLFKSPERHLSIIEALGKKASGLTQKELFVVLGIKPSGTYSKALMELEQCGFIRKARQFSTGRRNGSIYQLTDFYTLFYLKHIKSTSLPNARYWQSKGRKGAWNAWNGLAFERVCVAHVEEIKVRLGISGVATEVSAWRSTESASGAQIDLVINRDDGIVDLCEAKFTEKPFTVDAAYDQKLFDKREIFREETRTKKALHTVMVSASGLTEQSRRGTIQALVTLNDLFASPSSLLP